ncbi:signal transduction histidine kinase [Acidovorax sp. KKS102]|nr:tetratricopeptide repeat protein [Acidovorax sp. KKS102]AFU47819.1 signal transduction histidine kinase [Acidovorax sp. KKS102]
MRLLRPWVLATALGLFGALSASAQTPSQDLAELDRLQTLSQRNSAETVQALQAAAPRFARAAHVDTRRTYYAALADAAFETGQAPVVTEAIAQLKALASTSNDMSSQVLAAAFEARQLAVAGKTRAGLATLAQVAAGAETVGDPWVRWLYHLTLGALHSGNGQFEEALAQLLRSLELSRTLPRQAATAELRSRTHLELLHFDMKNPERALQTIREALPLAEKLDARQALGWLHLHRGNVENVQGDLDTAIAAYRQALQIARAGGLAGLQATALNNLGDVLLQRKAYAEAEPVMREALAAYRDAHELNGAALAQANLGFALMGQGRIAAGVHEVEAGIRFVHEAGSLPIEEQLLGELSRMYEQAGLYREAMATTRKQQALAKELFHTERDQAVATLQERFDSAERQRQIDQLAQANRVQDAELRVRRMQQIGLAAAVALALLAAGASFWLYRRTRTANEALAAARGQAESALTEKNMFLATASHDLRQPVHAMSLMVETISLRNTDPVLRPLVADLRASMQAMSQLFNALLDLSRLESGQPLGHKTAVDLGALLADVVRLFREQASLGGLTLRLRLPRRGATVWAEPVLLRQALANLVQNAIRYTPQGKVLVSARARGGGWLVEVRALASPPQIRPGCSAPTTGDRGPTRWTTRGTAWVWPWWRAVPSSWGRPTVCTRWRGGVRVSGCGCQPMWPPMQARPPPLPQRTTRPWRAARCRANAWCWTMTPRCSRPGAPCSKPGAWRQPMPPPGPKPMPGSTKGWCQMPSSATSGCARARAALTSCARCWHAALPPAARWSAASSTRPPCGTPRTRATWCCASR